MKLPIRLPPRLNLSIVPCLFGRNPDHNVAASDTYSDMMMRQDDDRQHRTDGSLADYELIHSIRGSYGGREEEEQSQQYQYHDDDGQQLQWRPRPAPDEAAGVPTPSMSRNQSRGSTSNRQQRVHPSPYHQPENMFSNAMQQQQHSSSVVYAEVADAAQQLQSQQATAFEVPPPIPFATPFASMRRPSSPRANIALHSEQWQRHHQPQQQAESLFHPHDNASGFGDISSRGQELAPLDSIQYQFHNMNLATTQSLSSHSQVNAATSMAMKPSPLFQDEDDEGHGGGGMSMLSSFPRRLTTDAHHAEDRFCHRKLPPRSNYSRHIDDLDVWSAPFIDGSIPSTIIQAEASSVGPIMSQGPPFFQESRPLPQRDHQRRKTSDEVEVLESMLRNLSPEDKDQLLRKLLLSSSQNNGVSKPEQHYHHYPLPSRHDVDLDIIPSSRTKSNKKKKAQQQLKGLSMSEKDMINVQMGILFSLKKKAEEEKKSQRKRKSKSPIKSVDDRALEFGIKASTSDYQKWLQEREKEAQVEQAMLDKARAASLMEPPSPAEIMVSLEECIIKQAKQESSLESSNSNTSFSAEEEACLVEEAKRASLAETTSIRRSSSSSFSEEE